MSNRLASVWTTIDDLTGKVAISIMKAKNELKRPGWERAKDYDEVSLLREIREVKEENEMLHEQINKYFDIGKFPIGWRLHLISCMMQFSNVPLIDYHSVLENTYIFLEKMKTNEMDIIIQKEIENQLAKLHELIVEDMNDLRYR